MANTNTIKATHAIFMNSVKITQETAKRDCTLTHAFFDLTGYKTVEVTLVTTKLRRQ